MASYAQQLHDDSSHSGGSKRGAAAAERELKAGDSDRSWLEKEMRDAARDQENALELNILTITKLCALPRQKHLDPFTKNLYDTTKRKSIELFQRLRSLETKTTKRGELLDVSLAQQLGFAALQIVRMVASHPLPSKATVKLGREMSADGAKYLRSVMAELGRDPSKFANQTFKPHSGFTPRATDEPSALNASDVKQRVSEFVQEFRDFDTFIDSGGNAAAAASACHQRHGTFASQYAAESPKDLIIDVDRQYSPKSVDVDRQHSHNELPPGLALDRAPSRAGSVNSARSRSRSRRSNAHRAQAAHGFTIDPAVSAAVWTTWQCPLPSGEQATGSTGTVACGCGMCAKLVPLIADAADVYMSVPPKLSRKLFIGLAELIQEEQFDIDASLSEVTRGLFTRLGFEGEFVPVPAPSALGSRRRSNASKSSRSRGSQRTLASIQEAHRPLYRLKRTKTPDDLEFLRGTWLIEKLADDVCPESRWLERDLDWLLVHVRDALADNQLMYRKKPKGGGGFFAAGSFMRNCYRLMSGCARNVVR